MTTLAVVMHQQYGYSVTVDKRFVYAEGNVPLLLVAHVDTVHNSLPTPLCYDPNHRIIWSPTGCGGDDRAGVAAILELLSRGQRPYVLFTDEEEKGGGGAKDAVKEIKKPPVNAVIEFDRRNGNDAVFYAMDTDKGEGKEFLEWVESFGFKKANGSFSDISILSPEWAIAGVNVSCGYYRAHSNGEYVVLSEWEESLSRVEEMLKSPPEKAFTYERKTFATQGVYSRSNYTGYWFDDWDDYYGNVTVKATSDSASDDNGKTKPATRTGSCVRCWIPEYYAKGNYNFVACFDCPFVEAREISWPQVKMTVNYINAVMTLKIESLVSEYGGTTSFWVNWLNDNKEQLSTLVEDFFIDTLEELIVEDAEATKLLIEADKKVK